MKEVSDNYTLVFERFKNEFITRNCEDIANNTFFEFSQDGRYLHLLYWGEEYLARISTGDIFFQKDFNSSVPVHDKLVIMSYLLDCKENARKSNNFVPFRSIKKAAPFEKAFINLGIKPLNEAFCGNLEGIRRAAEMLGGQAGTYGDFSVKFKVFPLIDLIYIFWEGDEEFPSQVNILFDENMTDFIHEECVPTIGIDGAHKLIGKLSSLQN